MTTDPSREAACPICRSNRVTVTEGTTWRKCRDCDAGWNEKVRAFALPSPEAAGGETERAAAVLAAHLLLPVQLGGDIPAGCSCEGWTHRNATPHPTAAHRAHQADMLAAAGLLRQPGGDTAAIWHIRRVLNDYSGRPEVQGSWIATAIIGALRNALALATRPAQTAADTDGI